MVFQSKIKLTYKNGKNYKSLKTFDLIPLRHSNNENVYTLQGMGNTNAILVIDVLTGKGVFTNKGSYFPYLSYALPCTFDNAFINDLKEYILNNKVETVTIF